MHVYLVLQHSSPPEGIHFFNEMQVHEHYRTAMDELTDQCQHENGTLFVSVDISVQAVFRGADERSRRILPGIKVTLLNWFFLNSQLLFVELLLTNLVVRFLNPTRCGSLVTFTSKTSCGIQKAHSCGR